MKGDRHGDTERRRQAEREGVRNKSELELIEEPNPKTNHFTWR
jgi:hypothetical protein